MSKKMYNLSLELEIKSISCPGVWLCLNGYISLVVSTLGIEYETKHLPPVFPLNFHEVFYFAKSIDRANSLTGLQKVLENESFQCLLIQWPTNCSHEHGKVLAKFVSSLSDVLYSPSVFTNCTVELLMQSSSSFPGILSPKIDIVSAIKIEESLETLMQPPLDLQRHVQYVDTNFVSKLSRRQQAVCHSHDYHRQKCSHDACKHSINRKSTFDKKINRCNHRSEVQRSDTNISLMSKVMASDVDVFKIHRLNDCGICSKYHRLFQDSSISDGLTYRIPKRSRSLSDRFDDDIPDRLHEKLEDIFTGRCSSSSRVSFNLTPKIYKNTETNMDSACLLKKFEDLNLKCLCK